MILRSMACAGLLLGTALGAAAAQADFYGGGQLNLMTLDRGAVKNANLAGINLRGGMELHELLDAEVRLGKAFGDDDYRNAEVENNLHYGIYARLTLPLEGAITPYGIGGYAYVENDVNDNTVSDDGESYGFGFDYALQDTVSLNLEYLRLADNDYSKQELIGLGATYRF